MTVAKQTWEQADIAAKKAVPEGLWVQCRKCGATIFGKTLEASLEVCPKCDHHHRVSARVRIRQIVDPESFEPFNADLTASDPLNFVDVKTYRSRIEAARKKSGENEVGIREGATKRKKKRTLQVLHEDIIKDAFWARHPWVLSG